jgi:hypothetical protein
MPKFLKAAAAAGCTLVVLGAGAGTASAQSACITANINIAGNQLVDDTLCLPPAGTTSTRTASANPSFCGRLYLVANGNEVVDEEVCLPPTLGR